MSTRPGTTLHLSVLALLLAACSKPAEPDPGGPRPTAAVTTGARPAEPSTAKEVTFQAPAAWTKVDNPSPMRKATYKVPHAEKDKEDGELTVSQAGGSVEMNVTRWAGQLGKTPADVKREKKKVAGLDVTVVEIDGDYAGMGMPGAAPAEKKTGWALLGAIVETSPPMFFKLTGPDATVLAARADFDRLVGSFLPK